MPFGRHYGCSVAELPDDYLEWLMTIELRGWLHEAVRDEFARRLNGQAREERTPAAGPGIRLRPEEAALARTLVEAGYRSLARELHPDVGGNTDEMQRLNSLVRSFRAQLAVIEDVK
jgi:hypothetical protein